MDSSKYERTFHLSWSPGGTSDDKRMKTHENLVGTEIVLTEKMDGSNVCLERDACYARTHSGPPSHPSFDAFKALHGEVRHLVPEGLQIFGEWCYALHSIGYSSLPGFFLAFGVRDLKTQTWASWDEVKLWAEELGQVTVPELRRLEVSSETELRRVTIELANEPSLCGGIREGVVARVAREYHNDDFPRFVGKFVRKDHVTTSEHWKNQEIVRNRLKSVM